MNLRQDKKIVHVGIALDESGSMLGIKKETLDGLNEQIQELKKHSNINSTVTLVTFSGPQDVKTIYRAKPVSEITEISDKDYNPDGMTAMYDGTARLFNELKQSVDDNENTTYLILVVSDGQENASVEYTSAKIASMVKERQDTKRWTISYIGANQDLTKVVDNFGLSSSNVLAFAASSTGSKIMWDTAKCATTNYMSVRGSSAGNAATYQKLSANFINSDSDAIVDISNQSQTPNS